jgi:hypothetical protein
MGVVDQDFIHPLPFNILLILTYVALPMLFFRPLLRWAKRHFWWFSVIPTAMLLLKTLPIMDAEIPRIIVLFVGSVFVTLRFACIFSRPMDDSKRIQYPMV